MPERILIVDDEASLARALALRLEAAGLEPLVVHTGEEALEVVERLIPDAIVLDVRMPGLSGHEVHERLRANPRTNGIPVIFLSANVQDAARESALASGAAAYLTKPYEPREVIEVLRDAVRRRPRSA